MTKKQHMPSKPNTASTPAKKKVSAAKAMPQKKNQKKKGKLSLEKIARIEKLPKTVQESIPFRGVMRNGIIETTRGTFTKSYKLNDINFNAASEDEQELIYYDWASFMNAFEGNTRWQINIFNHEIDKASTLRDVRIMPQRDGLNDLRQEMNQVRLAKLSEGNNSIIQDKYLTVAIDDNDAEHAALAFKRLDKDISKRLRKITKDDTKPMTLPERLELIYNVYNPEMDYRFSTGLFEGDEFDYETLDRQGLTFLDIVGPPSLDFSKSSYFMEGDTYGKVLYLEKVPKTLSTNFISDLGNIQSDMLISITSEAVDSEDAQKMVKNKLTHIDGQVSNIKKRRRDEGIDLELPPELEMSQEAARELMKDITRRNQNLFFMSIIVVVFADTKEKLDANVKQVISVAKSHLVPMRSLNNQQEFGLNTALPLCRNDLFVERLYTTESASIFIPFNAKTIMQKNALFYGLNQDTKSMIMYDRTTGDNFNGLIFGMPGSGKSVTAKIEMMSVILSRPDDQVYVIDPQGEYAPMVEALGGTRIKLSHGTNVFINPLDLNLSSDEDEPDPVAAKTDFVISMFDILSRDRCLDPVCNTIISRCVRKIYEPYITSMREEYNGSCTFDASKCPTLSDLYYELERQENIQASYLAALIEPYALGSFGTFAHRTNVEIDSRFVVYDLKSLGSGMWALGLHICTNNIWNRMIENHKKGIYTWFYIDEFHVLLESIETTKFLRKIWRMARKWFGVPTGITQNTEDLLRDSDSRAIVNTTSFIIVLKEPLMDRQNLAELLNLSPSQLERITGSPAGHGLLVSDNTVLPFEFEFPTNTKIFKTIKTSKEKLQASA